MPRLPGTFRRSDDDDETMRVTLPPRSRRLLARWIHHLASHSTAGTDDIPAAVTELERAGLVPDGMGTDEARVLLAIGVEWRWQRRAELGMGDN